MKIFPKTLFLLSIAASPAAGRAQLGDFLRSLSESAAQSLPHISFLGTKPLSLQQLVGTWSYQEPSLVFEDNNLVNRVSGVLSSGSVEKKLTAVLAAAGVTRSRLLLQIKSDGNFVATLNGKRTMGHVHLRGANLLFTDLQDRNGVLVNGMLSNGQLQIASGVTHCMQLLQFFGEYSANQRTQMKTLGELMRPYSGVQIGVLFERNPM